MTAAALSLLQPAASAVATIITSQKVHYYLLLKQDAVLSQGGPRDADVNFDTCRILQQHHAASLPRHGFFVGLCLVFVCRLQ